MAGILQEDFLRSPQEVHSLRGVAYFLHLEPAPRLDDVSRRSACRALFRSGLDEKIIADIHKKLIDRHGMRDEVEIDYPTSLMRSCLACADIELVTSPYLRGSEVWNARRHEEKFYEDINDDGSAGAPCSGIGIR